MKWLLVFISSVHGLIHLLGFFNETGIQKTEGFTGATLINLSGITHAVLSYAWLIPVMLFLTAAIGIINGATWWKVVALIGIVISQALIVIWWPDAKAGTVANMLLLAGVIFWKS